MKTTSFTARFGRRTDWFGVPIQDVKEVTTQTTCTRIPHAPREVAGYVNIRGHIFLALDLRPLLGFDAKTTTENRLIIFKQSVGPAFGVPRRRDRRHCVGGREPGRRVSGRRARTRRAATDRRLDLITRVCRLPTELLVVLEPRKFFASLNNR